MAYMGKIKKSYRLSPQQKFKNSLKRAGYDPDEGAKRLLDLLAKHKKEREEREGIKEESSASNNHLGEAASNSLRKPDEQTGVMSWEDLSKHIGRSKALLVAKHPQFQEHISPELSLGAKAGFRFKREHGFEHVDVVHGPNKYVDKDKPGRRKWLQFHFSISGKKINQVNRYHNMDNERHPEGNLIWHHYDTWEHPADKRENKRIAARMKERESVFKEEKDLSIMESRTNRTKRTPIRDFLRKYPVSDSEMVKPVKPVKKKEEKKVVAEGSGPKEKQKTPYRDINSPEYRKAADKQKQQMAKDPAAEPGKKLADKIAKKGVAEGYTGRETKDGTWRVFKDGKAVAVAGPFKSREEAAAWIKKQKQGVAEAAFKDPSPMFKDSIKQDKIRSLNNLISIAKVKGIHHKVKEYESELKKLKEEIEDVTEAGGVFPYKPPRKGSVAYNALMQRKEQDKKRVKEIEAIGTKNHYVGVARVVTKEDIEHVTEANDADKYSYIDQTKGPVLRGKTGTYVGYTHSTTKGKGANILKHNKTKKYYAAGGSSTAFTQKTTLHDTPEDAARAYHKGNLAEASPMIKPPKNEFSKKEDAFAHAKQHGGKVIKKTFTHPTSGRQFVSYVVKEDAEMIDELRRKTLASYISKAAGSYGRDKQLIGRTSPDGTMKNAEPDLKRAVKNRLTGINRAAERLSK